MKKLLNKKVQAAIEADIAMYWEAQYYSCRLELRALRPGGSSQRGGAAPSDLPNCAGHGPAQCRQSDLDRGCG